MFKQRSAAVFMVTRPLQLNNCHINVLNAETECVFLNYVFLSVCFIFISSQKKKQVQPRGSKNQRSAPGDLVTTQPYMARVVALVDRFVKTSNMMVVVFLSSAAIGCSLEGLSPPPLRYTAANHIRD